ncbi:U11/U12 small nuclear ribonucleoprotein 48 kDa protein isoform X2 [Silurus meridionalis]|uniref:U11/U12 small nuclear ribonucleoprotein 48 kDa protein isoform X2 n=1 Tax=Silurus meridionalis TaxID=175797 RepID=UPI001EEB7DCF|nr:U11/U12 small nuclear ribonucleoprotein 48 kDa protein isoform X2 [Silurus meridionalis]
MKMSVVDSSEVLQDRLEALHQLTEFTQNCRTQLTELLEVLGWSWDNYSSQSCVVQQDKMDVCPYDPNHTVPHKSIESHKTSCLLNQLGYSKEEQAEMYDPSFCYEKANIPTIKLDKHAQHQVIVQARANALPVQSTGIYCQNYSTEPADVPQNHKRAICDLTMADRLALYDHVILEAKQQRVNASNNEDLYVDLVSKLNKDEERSGPKSHLEVLAEMRDYRRRRQSYRAKNVHITKKSYTEIIREVIDVHSGELAKLWQEEKEEEEEEEEETKISQHSHRRPPDEVRSASVESRESHMSSREETNSHHKHPQKHSREHSQERGNKRRRTRDSHSPEHRHHKKKKKKHKS